MARMEDIATQYLFRNIFTFSRVFAIPNYPLDPGNPWSSHTTQMGRFYISHRKHRKHRNYLFLEHGWYGWHGWRILRLQYLFCDFRDFCVTIIFHAEGTFLSHTESTENTEIIFFSNTDGTDCTDGGYCAQQYRFSYFFVLSGSFGIPNNPLNLGNPWSFFFSGSLFYSEKARKSETDENS